MPSFPVSIATLSLLQAVLVALPRARPAAWAESLRSPWWAVIPAASIIVVIAIVAATPGSATVLSYLALIACPPLAALALGWLIRGSQPVWALAAIPLFALAWVSKGALAGESAAARDLLARLRHPRLDPRLLRSRPLAAMGDLRDGDDRRDLRHRRTSPGPQRGPHRRRAGRRAPRLQVIAFGAARMGFGDVFVAATTGCLLAGDRRRQLTAAGLAAVLGLAFDLLFFVLDTLPATVPVAVALALTQRLVPEGRDAGDAVRSRRPA